MLHNKQANIMKWTNLPASRGPSAILFREGKLEWDYSAMENPSHDMLIRVFYDVMNILIMCTHHY